MTKQLFFALLCLLSYALHTQAQTSDTFDISTFQPPPDWNKQTKGGNNTTFNNAWYYAPISSNKPEIELPR